jgi:hypothetical protein
MITLAASSSAQPVLYVDADVPGPTHDGSSWCSAYLYLQDALTAAEASGGAVTEIRVAEGVYKPDQGTGQTPGDREVSFQLLNGVALRGGFAGCGAPDPDERDIAAYETILSGDLEDNDSDEEDSDCCFAHPTPGCDNPDCEYQICVEWGRVYCCEVTWDEWCAQMAALTCSGLCAPSLADNSYHVIDASGADGSAVLDGFTVTAGNADSSTSYYDARGAGILNLGGSPTIKKCTIRGNKATFLGSGMFNESGASPNLTDCLFFANRGDFGAGMGNDMGSSPTLVNCAFIGNRGTLQYSFGGGMVNIVSSPTVIGCVFANNSAFYGGALVNDTLCEPMFFNCRFLANRSLGFGGAVFNTNESDPAMQNCQFIGNSAVEGGAVCGWSENAPQFVNCTFVGNVASDIGGGMLSRSGDRSALTNCILWGNSDSSGTGESAQVYSQHENGNGYPVVDYSCIQGGWTGLGGVGIVPDDPLFADPDGADDILGTEDDNLRLLPGSPCIDAGDNEAVPQDSADLDDDGDTTEPIPVDLDWLARFHDDPDTPDTGNGLAPIVDMGAHEFLGDCNENGIPDFLDLLHGTSQDCNENSVPDECDIADGVSKDMNQDGIPDECQEGVVPTVSAWGLLILGLLLLTAAKVFFRARVRSRAA